jgi:hypothetical protein
MLRIGAVILNSEGTWLIVVPMPPPRGTGASSKMSTDTRAFLVNSGSIEAAPARVRL